MATINAANPIRVSAGSTITIGADTLLAYEDGSLKFSEGGYEPVVYRDRGSLKKVIAGDERPCKLELSVKATGLTTTTPDINALRIKLFSTLASNKVANKTATGEIFTFPVVVKIPDGLGVATGTQITFAACFADGEDALTFQSDAEGANFAKINLKLMDLEMSPAITNY